MHRRRRNNKTKPLKRKGFPGTPIVRAFVASWCILTFWLLPSANIAHAQDSPAELDEMFNAIEFERDTGKREPIPASSVERINLGVHWQLILRVIDEGKDAKEEIEALREHLLSMGIQNDPSYMMAIIHHVDEKHAHGEISTEVAAANFFAASILAPDLPHAYMAHARHLLRHSPTQLGESTKSVVLGVKHATRWQDTARPMYYNLSLYALIAGALASVIFIVMQMLRYFSVLSYDVVRLLPRGFSSVQSVLALLAIILIPGLLLQSPLISLATLLICLGSVQQPRERIGSILVFAMIAALPFIELWHAPNLSWNVSSSRELMHAQYTECDDRCTQKWLTRKTESTSRDVVLDYTAWLAQYRAGDIEALLSESGLSAEAVEAWPATPKGQALNVLGAALIARNRPEEAIEVLDKAEALLPTSSAPSLNIMRAAQMTGDRDMARSALERANDRALAITLEFLALERRDVNSKLRVEPLPLQTFWKRHLAEDTTIEVQTIQPFWPLAAGPHLPYETSTWLGLLGIAILLLTLPIPLTCRCSTPCPSCGLARDPADSIANANHAYCLSCYESFVMGSTMSYNERVENDAMLQSRRRWQELTRRYLSLLMPGTGHLLTGYGVIGLLMVWLTLMAALILLRPSGFWRAPGDLLYRDWMGWSIVAMILLAALYATSLWILKQDIFPLKIKYYQHTQATPDAKKQHDKER